VHKHNRTCLGGGVGTLCEATPELLHIDRRRPSPLVPGRNANMTAAPAAPTTRSHRLSLSLMHTVFACYIR